MLFLFKTFASLNNCNVLTGELHNQAKKERDIARVKGQCLFSNAGTASETMI
ncbi:hypothetical protein DCCM_0671 [Desulfocucumis palustris]|uniref:Uncharacterized protein n=1 Tax=Desulfocucumis palustris TaxID=1898651 RepID=A0A2L2X8H1_9FIRM|nr:hypothetical protein DCCM_0671 [Desulfocucumis palustris]